MNLTSKPVIFQKASKNNNIVILDKHDYNNGMIKY